MAKSNAAEQTVQQPQVEAPKVKEVPAEVNALPTVSGKIRALANMGWTRGEIAKGLGKRYQHVRNVLIQPLKTPAAQTSK